eukprot:scaffold434_cov186-Pinguiococcus_pyrenoidosus.AAC.111
MAVHVDVYEEDAVHGTVVTQALVLLHAGVLVHHAIRPGRTPLLRAGVVRVAAFVVLVRGHEVQRSFGVSGERRSFASRDGELIRLPEVLWEASRQQRVHRVSLGLEAVVEVAAEDHAVEVEHEALVLVGAVASVARVLRPRHRSLVALRTEHGAQSTADAPEVRVPQLPPIGVAARGHVRIDKNEGGVSHHEGHPDAPLIPHGVPDTRRHRGGLHLVNGPQDRRVHENHEVRSLQRMPGDLRVLLAQRVADARFPPLLARVHRRGCDAPLALLRAHDDHVVPMGGQNSQSEGLQARQRLPLHVPRDRVHGDLPISSHPLGLQGR